MDIYIKLLYISFFFVGGGEQTIMSVGVMLQQCPFYGMVYDIKWKKLSLE